MRLPKRMIVAQTRTPPHVIHALHCKVPPIGTPEEDNLPSNSRISPPTTSNNNPEEIYIVQYKPAVDRETQMSQHTLVRNDDTKHLSQDWRVKVEIYDPYFAYRDEFMKMLTELKSTWDAHQGRTCIAKHCIKLLDDSTQSVYSTPYRARLKTRVIGKARLKRCSITTQ